MRFDVITLFPSMFEGALSESILKIAQEKGLVSIHLHNLRDHTLDPHRKVDDRPFGGGPGMVLAPDPVFRAYEAVIEEMGGAVGVRKVVLSPQGRRYDQALAREFAREKALLLLCGHYEGFDERIRLGLPFEEVSIGDYVLTGGEIPAMAILDSVIRLLPGVVGDPASLEEESFSAGMLDYPHYTRPREYRGMTVPEVLVSGDHAKILEWRREQALRRTKEMRRDLLGPEGQGDRDTSATQTGDRS
ncbi:MAG: tRNA (guanosine(37)-N1)-methyltransferase TrmD [Planctomycetes bacterium]|nr:tRNA (guanosine(37)-N1)-methyltransferase TrmD [Planctomycetota bacterium]